MSLYDRAYRLVATEPTEESAPSYDTSDDPQKRLHETAVRYSCQAASACADYRKLDGCKILPCWIASQPIVAVSVLLRDLSLRQQTSMQLRSGSSDHAVLTAEVNRAVQE